MNMGFQSIYETVREDEIALIKSLLEAEKINYLVENDHVFCRAEAIPMVVKIDPRHLQRAREVLKDFIER